MAKKKKKKLKRKALDFKEMDNISGGLNTVYYTEKIINGVKYKVATTHQPTTIEIGIGGKTQN